MRSSWLLASATVLALAACGTSQQQAGAPATAAPPAVSEAPPAQPSSESPAPLTEQDDGAASAAVEIVDFAFEPEALEVAAGTEVTWTQTGGSTHTVDFSDGEESDDLVQGDTYSRTFDEAGDYPYVCFFHPDMTGTVTVSD